MCLSRKLLFDPCLNLNALSCMKNILLWQSCLSCFYWILFKIKKNKYTITHFKKMHEPWHEHSYDFCKTLPRERKNTWLNWLKMRTAIFQLWSKKKTAERSEAKNFWYILQVVLFVSNSDPPFTSIKKLIPPFHCLKKF